MDKMINFQAGQRYDCSFNAPSGTRYVLLGKVFAVKKAYVAETSLDAGYDDQIVFRSKPYSTLEEARNALAKELQILELSVCQLGKNYRDIQRMYLDGLRWI